MLEAVKSGNNIILKTSLTGSYELERKVNTGSWEPWNGSGWGGVPVSLTIQNFTDYDLSDAIYQYRTLQNTLYDYSTCIPIGSDHVGWTFRNYTIPEGQFGEILTADDLHYTFMFGIDLVASNGQVWTDAQYQTLLEWSVYELEKQLSIHIFPREIYCDDEQNDAIEEGKLTLKEFPYPNRRNQRYNLRMRHRPVREVTRFDFFSPQDVKILDLLQWARLDKRNGQLNYKPN